MPDEPHIAPDGGEDAASPTLDSTDLGDVIHRAPLLPHLRHRFVLAGGATALVILVLLALLLTTYLPLRGGKASTAPTGTATAQETSGLANNVAPTNTAAQATAVGTRSPTPTPATSGTGSGTNGTNGTGGTGAPPAPTSASQRMRVTNLALAVDRTNSTGACTEGMPFTFTLTVRVAPHTQGGRVSYHWLSGDGSATQDVHSLSFGPGEVAKTATYTMLVPSSYGDGSQRWVAAQATAPNTLTSAHRN